MERQLWLVKCNDPNVKSIVGATEHRPFTTFNNHKKLEATPWETNKFFMNRDSII